MARERRHVGINPVRVNLPERTSIGPALIKTAQTVQSIAAERGALRRTQEAQLAASKLNFERDGDGNLVAPTLPIGSNGQVAPNIYDTVYTEMVGQRYVQQMKIDTTERLNLIATENRFDPSAYRKLAEGYVTKVTELAPDRLKGDVNNAAQITMVEHFNHIVRAKAERDHVEAGEVHLQSTEKLYDDMAGYAFGGADDEIVGAKMLEIRAHILQGEQFNYWNAAASAEQAALIDKRYAVAGITGDIARLAADPVTHAAAIEQLEQFALGNGTLRMVDEAGNVAIVDAQEIMPDPEEREAIAAVGIATIKNKEASRGSYETERHGRQADNFEHWFLQHSITQASIGGQLDMANLQSWFNKAQDESNEPLMKRIQQVMVGAYAGAVGESGTRAERRAVQALAFTSRQRANATNQFMKDNGMENLDSLSDEQKVALDEAIWRSTGPVDIPQSAEMAEDIGGMYDAMAGYSVDVGTASLDAIENWIDKGAGKIGVIPWGLSIPLNSMLNSDNEDQIDRALDIGRMLYNNNNTKANMGDSTALGTNGEALAYIFDNYAPGGIQAGQVTELLKNFGTPGWSPHMDWSAMHPDDREVMMSDVADELDGRFTSVIPTGFEVSAFNFSLRPELGGYPVEMEKQIFSEIRSRAGLMNPRKPETYDRHIDAAINTVVKQHGWVPSKLGWSESRFTEDKRPATNAFSQFAPEAFYRDPHGNADRNVLDQVEVDFGTHLKGLMKAQPSLPKLIAGENAFLEYNASQSVTLDNGRHIPAYNIITLNTEGRGVLMTSDRYTYGDQGAINFELAYQTGNRITMDTFRATQERKAKARLLRQQQVVNPGTAQ